MEDSMINFKHFVATTAIGLTAISTAAGAVTLSSIEKDGPYAIGSQSIPGVGFGGGSIHAPTKPGKYALVALCPGFMSAESSISQMGKRLATHGFVVVTMATNSQLDQPASRANQILAALKAGAKVNTGNAAGKIDTSRMVASGWSMGGGGTLIVASKTPSLKAAVAFAPWNTGTSGFSSITVPTMIFGATGDTVAPIGTHAQPFYNAIPRSTKKALAILTGSSHFFPNTAADPVSYNNIAWTKRFVDGDTSYSQFLTGADARWASFSSTGPF
jgi:dienelactone hydrolase